ncbi:OLC1v1025300C1 [Oldenlandia corymbosa var. corymbosa]|uniref:OLC1v1025300C1 n=1 Tax=Oldenlandia corymbosa var. corymbosa TaxID=529605 RepID=A0AAV1C654_OLDCO|nr:OLC1v1025300C1 [Oldenlandia corymbosa var. corymbosa]
MNCVRGASAHNYKCQGCSDPGFKFFKAQGDERALLDSIDRSWEDQYLAASLIAPRLGVSFSQRTEEATREVNNGEETNDKAIVVHVGDGSAYEVKGDEANCSGEQKNDERNGNEMNHGEGNDGDGGNLEEKEDEDKN